MINKDLICRKIRTIAETLFDKQRYSVKLQSEQELVINKKNEKVFTINKTLSKTFYMKMSKSKKSNKGILREI